MVMMTFMIRKLPVRKFVQLELASTNGTIIITITITAVTIDNRFPVGQAAIDTEN